MKLKIKFTHWEQCVINWIVAAGLCCAAVCMLAWVFTS